MIDFPAASREAREKSILGLRPPRNALNPLRPYGFFVEEEPRPGGGTDRVAAIFLTNRECPWHCLMCDLWKNTLEAPTPKGAIPAQVRYALERLPAARHVKLYNAGSFFDGAAVPAGEHAAIAALVGGFDRVVVECHPALVGNAVLRFYDLLAGPELEVAIGLETARPEALEKLNKGMTVEDFERASRFLTAHGVRVRSFILVGVPFLRREEWAEATRESIDVSFRAGAQVVSLIPTRLGNGAMEELQRQGLFEPPALCDLEMAMEDSFERERGEEDFLEWEKGKAGAPGIVLADLWNAPELAAPGCCAAARVDRLRQMNLIQRNLPFQPCPSGLDHSARVDRESRGA